MSLEAKMLVGSLLFMIGLISLVIYDDCTADKVWLRKDQWTCTATGTRRAGRTYHTVCIKWEAR